MRQCKLLEINFTICKYDVVYKGVVISKQHKLSQKWLKNCGLGRCHPPTQYSWKNEENNKNLKINGTKFQICKFTDIFAICTNTNNLYYENTIQIKTLC